MKIPEIERGCLPTFHQELVESLVYAAERAIPGMRFGIGIHVTDDVNVAMADLCWSLALHLNRRARTVSLNGVDQIVGIKLSPGMVLTTHFTVRDVESLSGKQWVSGNGAELPLLLDDGGPAIVTLTGAQFRAAFIGALRLVEREAKRLVESEDYNWGAGDDDEEVEEDDDWHPEAMLDRVRAMKREVRRLLAVDEVLSR